MALEVQTLPSQPLACSAYTVIAALKYIEPTNAGSTPAMPTILGDNHLGKNPYERGMVEL